MTSWACVRCGSRLAGVLQACTWKAPPRLGASAEAVGDAVAVGVGDGAVGVALAVGVDPAACVALAVGVAPLACVAVGVGAGASSSPSPQPISAAAARPATPITLPRSADLLDTRARQRLSERSWPVVMSMPSHVSTPIPSRT